MVCSAPLNEIFGMSLKLSTSIFVQGVSIGKRVDRLKIALNRHSVSKWSRVVNSNLPLSSGRLYE